MPRPSRRQLLAFGGSSILLSGCLGRLGVATNDGTSLSDPYGRALDAVPATVDSTSVSEIDFLQPRDDGHARAGGYVSEPPSIGLDLASIDLVATARYSSDPDRTITALVGSFDQDDVDILEGYAVGVPGASAVSATDRIAHVAETDGDSWTSGLDAAIERREGNDTSVSDEHPVGELLDPIVGKPMQILTFDPSADDSSNESLPNAPDIAGVSAGIRTDLGAREWQFTFVLRFHAGATVEPEPFVELLQSQENGFKNVSTEEDGDVAVITGRAPLPERVPDNAPEQQFSITYDDGAVAVRALHDRSLEVANLEVRIDGTVVDAPWEPDASIGRDDSFRIEAPALSIVSVHWLDPAYDDSSQLLSRGVAAASDPFDHEYDADRNELTLAYDLDVRRPAEEFAVAVLTRGTEEPSITRLSSFVDQLDVGTTISIEDVSYGNTVVIARRRPDRPEATLVPFQQIDLYPPADFELVFEDEQYVLVTRTDSPLDASAYRIFVDDVATDAQWTDQSETIREDDRLALSLDAGSEVIVEYVSDDEPIEVFSEYA